jgi:hypothetical protein
MKKVLLLLIFFFFISFLFAKTDSVSQSQLTKTRIDSIFNLNNAEIYSVLYEESKKSNTELLETFRWSIASIIIILLAVFGSNIFFNFRFNKKELENLLQQIDLKIQEVRTSLLNEIETENEKIKKEFDVKSSKLSMDFESLQKETISGIIKENNIFKEKFDTIILNQTNKSEELIKNMKLKVSEITKELSNNYQNQLDTFNKNYSQQINSLNESFNLQIKTLTESYNQQFRLNNEKTDERINSLSKELSSKESSLAKLIENSKQQLNYMEKRLKMDSARIKVNLWDHKEVYANSLTYRVEELLYAIEFKTDLEFYLSDLLDNLNKMKTLSKWDYNKVKEMIDKIDNIKYEKQKETILEIINNTTIK